MESTESPPSERVVRASAGAMASQTLLAIGCGLSGLALCVSIYALSLEMGRVPERVYFSADGQGRLIELAPVGAPHYSRAFVSDWLVKSLTELWGFSHRNWRSHLTEQTQAIFTDSGRNLFLEALANAVDLGEIEQTRSWVSMEWHSNPLLIFEGLRQRPDGTYYRGWDWIWRAQTTLVVSNEAAVSRTRMKLTAVVTRTGMRTGEVGLALRSLVLVPEEGGE